MATMGLRSRLRDKTLTIGSWLTFSDPLLAEMMAGAGFDFLVVDMEHGLTGPDEAARLIQVIDLAGAWPLVRVGANDPLLIKRSLDAGAAGIIVPDIRSALAASEAVAAVKYPPAGRRGVGLSRAQGFGMDFDGYKEWVANDSVLIVQIEHMDAVAVIDDILAVDGVDGFIVGPYDMSGSVGKPGQFDDPDVRALLDRVAETVTKSAKPGGYHIVHTDPDGLQARLRSGCRFMAYGVEMIFLAEKLREVSATLKTARREADDCLRSSPWCR